jgi:RNA polymerase sigma factor (sigma-70 family)
MKAEGFMAANGGHWQPEIVEECFQQERQRLDHEKVFCEGIEEVAAVADAGPVRAPAPECGFGDRTTGRVPCLPRLSQDAYEKDKTVRPEKMLRNASVEELKDLFTRLVSILEASRINHHVAEDAAMDALWKELKMEHKPVDLEAWISRVALNAAYTECRKTRVAKKHRQSLAYHAARLREKEALEPWAEAARREEMEILAQVISEALQTLTVLDRHILTLHDVTGATIRELAECFEVTNGAIKGRLQRARVRMRRYLSRRIADLRDEAA